MSITSVHGDGVPVVLVHGWPQTSYVWRKVVPLLTPRHRVICVDLPGLGQSSAAMKYDTKSVVVVIGEELAAHGVERFHLVGHDIGAWVAAAFALHAPRRLLSMTAVDAAIPGLIADEIFVPANAARMWQFYFHGVPEIPELLVGGRERVYMQWYFDHKARVPGTFTEIDIQTYVDSYASGGRMHNSFEYYRAFVESSQQNRAAKVVDVPMLAVGAEFGVGPAIGQALQKIGTNVRGEVIVGSGHYVPEEKPQELADLLLAHFSRNDPVSRS
jgi:pimeloyl-ACP methyl ester carboxylesterase